jgi:acyl-[acyl-carrier-protein]-phospholipid O-acyltransferase / long-chain-fatty-acid--[acyl-carrier-protein] ligase
VARRSYLPLPLELVVGSIGKLLYRVRSRGVESVPRVGGAVIIANHLSYADVVALQLACPRPLRFIGYEGPEMQAWLVRAFRLAGVIPISAGCPSGGMRLAIKALQSGELVCLFPEGQISRTGQLMEVKRGFEILARRAGVPVIPVAIDGLWGSVFSFAGHKYLWKSPRLTPTHVFVAFGRPIPPGEADVAAARRALLDLGAEAFEERPALRRHVGREVVRELAKAPWRRVIVDRTAARREISAAQLLVVAAVLARRLRKTIPENRIGIVLPPGAGAFIANLAVVCAGKVPVNLNFTAGRAAVEASMAVAGVRAVISAEAMRSRVPDFPWPGRTLEVREEIAAAMRGGAVFPRLLAVWLLPNQWVADLLGLPRTGDRAEAALLFTSGSAGEPKGVVLTHRNILANCAQISSLSILPRTCTMLGCLPVFRSFGLTVTLWYPLLRGCRLVTVPSPLDTRRIVEAIEGEQVSVLVGAPTFLRPILKKARSAELRSLELVVAGAEKLPDDLYWKFLEAFHLEILQGYGLTETAPVTSVNQHHPPVTTATAGPQAGKKTGTVGRLLPGMTARIIDPDTGVDLPLTSTGIVCLRGANVFSGYLGDGKATGEALRGGWFVTGDVGRFDNDGFLAIEGRLSRFSKVGGEMVPHGRIEQKLAEVLSLDQTEGPLVVVLGVPDPVKGETLVLLAALDLDLAQVREALAAAGLPNLWAPKIIYRVDKIPLLATGKIDLKACREMAKKAL